MTQSKQLMVAGVVLSIVGALTGCSASRDRNVVNNNVASHTSSPVLLNSSTNSTVETKLSSIYPIIIFKNSDYINESAQTSIITWWNGNVSKGAMPILSKPQSLAHSPWHTDPVETAAFGTSNFQSSALSKSLHDVKGKLSYSYNGHKVLYRLADEVKSTTSVPNTATVITSGLAHNLKIRLFRPRKRYTWVIYEVEMMN